MIGLRLYTQQIRIKISSHLYKSVRLDQRQTLYEFAVSFSGLVRYLKGLMIILGMALEFAYKSFEFWIHWPARPIPVRHQYKIPLHKELED